MNNTENINYPKPKREYKVLVRCFTYNHSKYIEDALNGFAIQQTNFPYVCFVMDDASTDGEQEVIKNWMERECDMRRAETFDIPTSVVIIVPHKNNQSCTFAFYLLKQNLNGTGERKMKHVYPWREKCMYEALCEGDDYWINPLKLEMQYNALEADSQATMVYCNFDTIDSNGNKLYRSEYEKLKKYYRSGDNLSRLFTSMGLILFCNNNRSTNNLPQPSGKLSAKVPNKPSKGSCLGTNTCCLSGSEKGLMANPSNNHSLSYSKAAK